MCWDRRDVFQTILHSSKCPPAHENKTTTILSAVSRRATSLKAFFVRLSLNFTPCPRGIWQKENYSLWCHCFFWLFEATINILSLFLHRGHYVPITFFWSLLFPHVLFLHLRCCDLNSANLKHKSLAEIQESRFFTILSPPKGYWNIKKTKNIYTNSHTFLYTRKSFVEDVKGYFSFKWASDVWSVHGLLSASHSGFHTL